MADHGSRWGIKCRRHSVHSVPKQLPMSAKLLIHGYTKDNIHSNWGALLESLATCSQCKMQLLTSTSFEHFMLMCGERNLWGCASSACTALMHHPKMPKLMAKSFIRSRQCFRLLCEMLIDIFERRDESDHSSCSDPNDLTTILDMFFLIGFFSSIKYWNLSLLEEFVVHCGSKILCLPLKACANSYCQLICHIGLLITMRAHFKLSKLVVTVPKGAIKDQRFDVLKKGIQFYRSTITGIRQSIRHPLYCSSDGCIKMQGTSDRKFKVCRGCLMAHYCSRSCQKRAWPTHKSSCIKFHIQYSL